MGGSGRDRPRLASLDLVGQMEREPGRLVSFDDLDQSAVRPLTAVTEREHAARVTTRRAAARLVATQADGVDDCVRLLDMLGLHPNEGRTP